MNNLYLLFFIFFIIYQKINENKSTNKNPNKIKMVNIKKITNSMKKNKVVPYSTEDHFEITNNYSNNIMNKLNNILNDSTPWKSTLRIGDINPNIFLKS